MASKEPEKRAKKTAERTAKKAVKQAAKKHPGAVIAIVVILLILIAVTAMVWIFAAAGRRISRAEGVVMVLCYASIVTFAILR